MASRNDVGSNRKPDASRLTSKSCRTKGPVGQSPLSISVLAAFLKLSGYESSHPDRVKTLTDSTKTDAPNWRF